MAAQPSTVSPTPTSTGASENATTAASSSDPAAHVTETEHDRDDKLNGVSLPVRDKESFQRLNLERYITHDWVAASALFNAQDSARLTVHPRSLEVGEWKALRNEYRQWFTPSRLYGEGYSGYGNRFTENHAPSRILYPSQKPRPAKRLAAPLRWKRKDMSRQAEQHEELVPVRVDVDYDRIKLRDTFTWNLHDRIVPVELFVATLVEDMGIKPHVVSNAVFDLVVHQVHEQLNDFYPFAYSEEDALDPELPYSAYKNDEMRILIKLNITIGAHTLVDQFEWEMNNPLNSPEEFAASMAQDLALSGEFTTAIAHCIREQTQLFTRSLYSIGHPFDGRPIEDPDLVSAFLPTPLPTVFRPQQQAKEFAPYLYELSEADLERNETIFSREQRRQKRSVNRRGGPQLPDLKERQRTIRTLIVSSVLPGAAPEIDESRLYKRAAGIASGRKRNAEVSDSEESDDSLPESPGPAQPTGTARTRNMRGAASAAQQRMANLGRSETPEATITHHHETRTSRRHGRDAREETEEPGHLWITLRVNGEKLRRLLNQAPPKPPVPAPQTPVVPNLSRATSATAPSAIIPPRTPSEIPAPATTTPSAADQTPQTNKNASVALAQIGRLPAPPPVPGRPPPTPPPPPEWLVNCLVEFEKQYEHDSFEALMKYMPVNSITEMPIPSQSGQPLPDDLKYMFMPRIRCKDCPGKLYTPGPEKTAGNFEVHLKNNKHRDKVNTRVGHDTKPAVVAPAT